MGPEACLAKSEAANLTSMRFDPTHWSNAYNQCIGRGLSPKECVASLADDARITSSGPLAGEAAHKDLAGAIECMQLTGNPEKCTTHFDALARVAGFKEEVPKTTTEKASDFCSKAGWKILGFPALWYGMKFIKIK